MTDDAPPRRATFAVGDVLDGKYRLERLLGEGGSSVVYVAQVVAEPIDEPTAASRAPLVQRGDRVALKLIQPHLAHDSQISARFAREARILRRLAGDHVASLLDYGELANGQLFMAQKWVTGESLDQLAGGKPMPAVRAMKILLQVCTALEVAHEAGVIHRDLKPQNVIVDAREGKDHVHVLDFGMAKILRGELEESANALTQQNMVFGTPEYLSPEQARGDDVDERADIYSAGVILYELVTGTVPFRAKAPIATMTAHVLEQPEPPSRRAPGATIAPALEGLVMHALAKQPDERYPDARTMAAAIRSAIEHPRDTESIRPPSPAPDPGLWDTDLALHMAESVQPTQTQLEPPERVPGTASAQPLGGVNRTMLLLGIAAALLGIALGILVSLVGAK